jgi:hypothetical protein
LIRLYLHPETSDILSVPLEHVAKQVFLHQQQSNLTIYQNGQRVGGTMLRPHRVDDKGLRVIDFSGTLTLRLPFTAQQRIAWHGGVQMNRAFNLQDVDLHFVSHDPPLTTELHYTPERKLASYSVKQGNQMITASSLTLDQAGVESFLQNLGVDPSMITQATAQAANNTARVTAREGQLLIHGERTDVFHITVFQNETPMIEADISQLGQILAVKTALGYSMAPEDLTP